MTKLAVSIMVRSLDQALQAASRAAVLGADLVEFRIDSFTESPDELSRLIEQAALPCIITCRPTWEGGFYDGDEQTRISLLEHAGLGSRQPAWIDLEWACYQRSSNIRQKISLVVDHPQQVRPTQTGLMLSYHDFERQPTDLVQQVQAMAGASDRGAVKVAWQATSLLDNLTAFKLLLQKKKPTVALCMGAAGLPSRVLARKFGAMLSFAALDQDAATAPGQPTISELRERYRWDHLGPQTRVYGVIGHPVGHSLSPLIHNAGFDKIGHDGVYLPLPIEPSYESFERIVDAWLDMPQLHFRGASVTIPHKENLIRFVRERGGQVDLAAQQIGAANTLTRSDDGTLHATNTDRDALLDAVCQGAQISKDELKGKRVAVIGAGGVARAAVAGFAQYGATVVVYNRSADKAQKLAEAFRGKSAQVVAASLDKLCQSCCEIFVQCTPVGMAPHTDATPLSVGFDQACWPAGAVVFDTIYHPMQTRLLQEARRAGCTTVSGVEMFLHQAAAQFRIWTGQNAPVDTWRPLVLSQLA